MALIHAIHFDAGVFPLEITVSDTSPTIVTSPSRTGTRAMALAAGNGDFQYYARLSLSGAQSEFYVQFAWRCASTPLGLLYTRIFRWEDSSGTVLGGLKINNISGKIGVYTGAFATLVATGSIALAINTWYVIEVHVVIGDAGSITVRVDLNEDSAFSGDTQPGATTQALYLRWGNLGASGITNVDDIVVNTTAGIQNNSWPNGSKVCYLLPTGDGATKDWTPSTGTSHYALVDEVPPLATDNLQAIVNDKVDILTFPDLPGDAQSVRAVIPEVYVFKGSSTAPTRLALGIDINGEGVAYSAAKDLALVQGLVRNLWEERPGGGNFSVVDIINMSLYLKSAA